MSAEYEGIQSSVRLTSSTSDEEIEQLLLNRAEFLGGCGCKEGRCGTTKFCSCVRESRRTDEDDNDVPAYDRHVNFSSTSGMERMLNSTQFCRGFLHLVRDKRSLNAIR